MADNHNVVSAPERRERQDALENRRRILAEAKRLFAEQGVDNTSMYEIARSAGVGQGTLYRRFAHKGELCQALIYEDVEEFKERVGAAITGDGAPASALARLDLLISEKIRLTEQHVPLFAAIDEAAAGPRRGQIYRGPFHTWLHTQISSLLSEAIAQGEVRDLDVEFAAGAILAVTSPALFCHQRLDRGHSVERIVEGTRDLFITRLRADG